MAENQWQEFYRQIFKENLHLLEKEIQAEKLNAQFAEGGEYQVIRLGELTCPTGSLVIGDPLCYLGTEYSSQLEGLIKKGRYPLYLSVLKHPVFGTFHLSAKLDITGASPVRYEIAMPKGHGIEDINKPGVLAGCGVDSGLACICDQEAERSFGRFLKEWKEANPGKNHYDDYFAAKFKESHRDYLNFTVPGQDGNIIMFRSGMGDGLYLAYWGYDEKEEICCLILRLMDPEAFDVPHPERIERKTYYIKSEEIKPLVDSPLFGIATDRIMVEGCKVGYMYRQDPHEEADSGWVFFEGTESQEYLDDSGNLGLYHLNTIANYDPEIIPFLNAPVGNAYYRDRDGKFYLESR